MSACFFNGECVDCDQIPDLGQQMADEEARHIALNEASKQGRIDVMKLLLKRYGKEFNLDWSLYFAASGNQVEAASLLLQNGANINNFEYTLAAAAQHAAKGDMKLLDMLLYPEKYGIHNVEKIDKRSLSAAADEASAEGRPDLDLILSKLYNNHESYLAGSLKIDLPSE